jgi:hypothetical protein
MEQPLITFKIRQVRKGLFGRRTEIETYEYYRGILISKTSMGTTDGSECTHNYFEGELERLEELYKNKKLVPIHEEKG